MREYLDLLEALRTALDARTSYTEEELARRLGVSPQAPKFQAALRHLDDRLEILVEAEGRRLRGRRRLTADLLEALAGGDPLTQAELRAALRVETPAVAEVVGWLLREGRVEIVDAGGVERVKLKRGASGAQRATES
jgi:Mn-dependent DtxR family transcriptional regulator